VSEATAIPNQDMQAHVAPLIGELNAAALRVIASGRYILGGEGEAFEKAAAAACGVREAIAVSSGTDALLVLLMALGIGRDDEVVTTPFTFFATAGAIARLGARPVFVDIEPETLNLDPVRAAGAIGSRTRAVMTVHLFGRLARTEGLAEACQRAAVPLLEDAAQAIGARVGASGPTVGKLGRAAALSFFPAKNLGCLGDGGMVITDDAELARAIRRLRVHGGERRYYHEVVGGNFRLDEIQTAFLRVMLPHLPRWTDLRRQAATRYRANLSDLAARVEGFSLPPDDPGCAWNQFVVRIAGGRRDALAEHLRDRGITTAIYYPVPLHLQKCFASLGHRPGDFPEAERACQEVLALPIYPEMPEAHLSRVCQEIEAFFGK
jgi:dTDP-4-amino-4,6-dideoxygalactose transaminase